MKSISKLLIGILVFSFLYIGFSEIGEAGILPPPANPECCANNGICTDNSIPGPFMCPIGSELVEGSLCNANAECTPVEPITRNVPALSTWGFASLGVGLAILALGAMLLRKRKQHS